MLTSNYRKRFLGAATVLFALTGCSTLSSTPDNPQTSAVMQSFNLLFGDDKAAPERAQLAQLPYPVSYVQFDEEAPNIIVLGSTGNHGQYWYSASNEALTLWQGRIIRSSALTRENRVHTSALSADPLACYLQGNNPAGCSTRWQRAIQIERPVADFNPHQPQHELARFELESSFVQQGRDITETGRAIRYAQKNGVRKAVEQYEFSNSYRLSQDGNYVIESKQWLSPAHGYVHLDMVNLAGVNAPRPAVASSILEVPVQTPSPRLAQVVAALPEQFYPDTYWPGLRIHSDRLDSRFAARHAGMLKRLRMLTETYRYDGDKELTALAEELTAAFAAWPLRASYVHGVDPARMLTTLQENPVLNHADGDSGYQVVIAASDATPQQVGLAAVSEVTESWSVQPNGEVQRLADNAKGERAGLTLVTVRSDLLPKGFRDVNAQLAMFLQHWNYAADAQGGGQ
ncbi:hypothetical protein CWI80_04120 [Pseudidiomarina sediminum]|uniref:Capsule biosynthesis GfcC-like N-terminal domain-containing protein n=1 Tax=Pseudidiomarina sediminum TaxID=431675 RepID=A0A432Z9C3_9GAMM|nr:YjbF family lipoprotein [Pseudidiomarina sediminum]RUO74534.1 hypothetical protein CWI80_04120 [Pseudidiomarina sediminum]